MTRLNNDPAAFVDDAVRGLASAYSRHLMAVPGGVVRATQSPGEVAVLVGGGSGHYPAFAGWVGPGFAHGAPMGNIFSSPSSAQILSVARAADNGAGILMTFGNYTGDVIHFGLAAEQLRSDGIDVRIVTVTDDIASAPPNETERRRGIAGDFLVAKTASAAAAAGCSLDEVERIARKSNAAARTLGVAYGGCTLPGAAEPLFTVPDGMMSIGLGVHGEPGIRDVPITTAADTVDLLIDKILTEVDAPTGRVAVLVNGLGGVKYEELFVAYARVHERLAAAGLAVVEPEVGEHVTSLEMPGFSISVLPLDEELETYWLAPADAPGFRRGTPSSAAAPRQLPEPAQEQSARVPVASPASQELARDLLRRLRTAEAALREAEAELGRIDAVAADGDHGIGMVRGIGAAVAAAERSIASGAGAGTTAQHAGTAWAEHAGGTSGALWGMALMRAGAVLGDERGEVTTADAAAAAAEAVRGIRDLGGAEPGDKTMVDAAQPFADALAEAADQSLALAWEGAVRVAREKARATAELAARRGRARVLAERSVGTPDPGAISFALVMAALAGIENEQEGLL